MNIPSPNSDPSVHERTEPLTLTVVIPALDEEEAIGDTVRRCLEAREHIIAKSPVEEVEIIVVSDGSTDRTEEIARTFDEVTTLVFAVNRGYGAAIKCGFEHGRGQIVGFLDADGTCDPRIFADLCRTLEEDQADVVLGSRLGPGSEMPWIRNLGNTIFAAMLGLLSKQRVADTASGMRVIRRDALPRIYPLPDGLHFTPAMSARALISGDVALREVPMPYAERVGRSKLSVVKDGVRFLKVILQAAMCFRPSRPILLAAIIPALVALATGFGPLAFYLREGRLEEWMIYRVMLSSLASSVLVLLVSTAVVADRMAALTHGRGVRGTGLTGSIARLFDARISWLVVLLFLGAGVASAYPGVVDYLRDGTVDLHWSRAVLAALCVGLAGQVIVTSFLLGMLHLIRARADVEKVAPADRIHPAGSRDA